MDWLFPAVIASLTGTLVLTGTYFYLYFYDRQKFLLIWGTAWLIYATRDICTLLSIVHPPGANETILFIAGQLAALSSGMLLLWGTYVFTRRVLPGGWLLFALVNACWIIGGSGTDAGFASLTIPTYFFLGLVYIWTGLVIKNHFHVRGAGHNFTVCAFILWGVHKLDYPFLRPVAWFAPWGYLLSATLEITVAIGMLLIYFESTREALAKNITELKNAQNQLRIAYAKDISERRKAEEERLRLEEQVRRAQKLEALGTLAGGIAHDFNNILGVILGYAEIARDDTPHDSATRQDLDNVLAAGYRARDLILQILAFSRQSPVERIPLQPQAIVREALTMLRASLPSTIAIREDISPDCGVICADPIQLHQIVMNLGINGFHAMETTGGILRVEMKKADTVPQELSTGEGGATREFVRLSVSDTGCGISPEIINKIFDPFFTTKELGKGTGMGLSVVYGIVHEYDGTILVDSQPGKGSTFHVYIPCCSGDECPEAATPETVAPGQGHILLVDDEVSLGEMGRTLLARLGYKVTLCTGSIEALETFQNDPARFDLVITDQTMPEMTGIDMARRMLQLRPDLPIILCTGYSSLVNEETARGAGIKAFALKPLTRGTLSQLIRAALDQP